MQFTVLFTALLSALTTAKPLPNTSSAQFKPDLAAEPWRLLDMQRVCDEWDSACTFSFTIDPSNYRGRLQPVHCEFNVDREEDKRRASQSDFTFKYCGNFRVQGNWEGNTGPGEEFIAIAISDDSEKITLFAGYRDVLLEDGKVVKPDRAFTINTWDN